MAEVAYRRPQLNLLNVEATAAARMLQARVLLSPASARGILAATLGDEGVAWQTVALAS
jgi:hypothetical protein